MNLCSVGALSAAVCFGAWGWLASLDSFDLDAPSLGRPRTTYSRPEFDGRSARLQINESPSIATTVWTRSLQNGFRIPKTIEKLATEARVATAVQKADSSEMAMTEDLGLRLVGTVIEEGRSMAIVIDKQGRLDFRSVGETLQLVPEGVKIESVSANLVNASYKGLICSWALGQSLKLNSRNGVDESKKPAPTALKPIPKMSIDEELDQINRNPRVDPL